MSPLTLTNKSCQSGLPAVLESTNTANISNQRFSAKFVKMSNGEQSESGTGSNQTSNVDDLNGSSSNWYYAVHRFLKDSKLHRYLSLKASTYISITKTDYTLYEVLLAMRKVISNDELFDPQNPTVILCDSNLEDVLDVKALHVSEIRDQVCKQFPMISPPEPVSAGITGQATGQLGGQTTSQPSAQDRNQKNVTGPNFSPIMTRSRTRGGLYNLKMSGSNPEPAVATSHAVPVPALVIHAPSVGDFFALPAWASNTANAVLARFKFHSTPFDVEAKYWVKPDFLKVLRAVQGVNQTQQVFFYRDITTILSSYIMMNRTKFFDLRNIRIALVENDPLGKAFGVKAFARSQVTSLIRSQLDLYVDGSDATKPSDEDSKPDEDAATLQKRKRHSDDELFEEAVDDPTKRQCFCSNDELPKAPEDNNSPANETVDSSHSQDTTLILDDTTGTDSDSGQDQEDIYRVEYEVDNGTDVEEEEKRKRERAAGSEDDSDFLDVTIPSDVTRLMNQSKSSDISNGESSDAETSTDATDSTFDLCKPRPRSIRRCLNCEQNFFSIIRYCHFCWRDRKSWIPERTKPRRRKKVKKTKTVAAVKQYTQMAGTKILGATSSGKKSNFKSSVVSRSRGSDFGIGQVRQDVQSSDLDKESSDDDGKMKQEKMDVGFAPGLKRRRPNVEKALRQGELPPTLQMKLLDSIITPDNCQTTRAPDIAEIPSTLLCPMCCFRPKDASFVHGKISHQVSCYSCAKKIFTDHGTCPVCRRKIEKITRNFVM